jgi:Ser/Thr protein kinase RdoA (MazF antagonist)
MQRVHASKPPHICDPTREVEAYELLGPERLGTPCCYASGRWWLVLEKVTGVELWQRGDLEAWQDAARWAARLHRRFAGEPPSSRRMLRHDETLHRLLLTHALARIGKPLEELRRPCEVAIARLRALPHTVIHGELYASNVLVGDGRIAAVDWEMIAQGPGVIDLAALVTGWEGDDRRAILAAYGGVEEADLAAAQLLLALQWLGWAPDWQAPPEHRRDWFSEARAAANMLE